MPSNRKQQNQVFWVLVCLLCAYPAAILPGKITLATSQSVDPYIFWTTLSESDSKIERNFYVRFLTEKKLPGVTDCSPCLLVKRVGCGPGSLLETRGDKFYCDSIFLGKAHREKFFKYNSVLGPDQFFVVGDIRRSYDSRYFGLIARENINAILTPLF